MNLLQRSRSFEFDDEGARYQQINPVLPDGVSAIKDRDRFLPFELNI